MTENWPKTAHHIPTLDGVRGLAILMVLTFHFTDWCSGASQWLRAGWIGVDLFFVLSGFLITGILLDTKDAANYFSSFYTRRALRIFPLYFGVLAAVFLIGPTLGLTDFPTLASKQGWLWSYCSNIYLSIDGRIDLNADWLDLNHFWSLAIEEHFYLVWPAVVLALGRKGLIRACLGCIAFAIVSRTLMIAIWSRPAGTYFLTFCRIDSLALGGLMAILARSPEGIAGLSKHAKLMLLWGGVVVTLLGLRSGRIAAADRVMQAIGFTALAVFFAGLVALAASAKPTGIWHRIWTNRILTTIGRYSYGIYVYHQLFGRPLALTVSNALSWVGPTAANLGTIVAGVMVNTAVAAISYHVFESRFLRLKGRFAPRSAADRVHQPLGFDEPGGVDLVPFPLRSH